MFEKSEQFKENYKYCILAHGVNQNIHHFLIHVISKNASRNYDKSINCEENNNVYTMCHHN